MGTVGFFVILKPMDEVLKTILIVSGIVLIAVFLFVLAYIIIILNRIKKATEAVKQTGELLRQQTGNTLQKGLTVLPILALLFKIFRGRK